MPNVTDHDESPESLLKGKTALVTGASDGIGWEIAKALAQAGSRVIMPVRNREKGERATARIKREVPEAHLTLMDLDLARLDTVTTLAETLARQAEPIELLVLNAGIVQLTDRTPQLTCDGFELTFQTNYLAHVALTLALLPLLRAGNARIAVQCSLAAADARVPWGELNARARGESSGARAYHPFRAYRTSKVALGLFGVELARRSAAAGWGLGVQLCHPGIAPGSAIAPEVRALFPRGLVERIAARVGNPPRTAAHTALAALAAAHTSDISSRPRMWVPDGPLELAGRPKERTLYRSLDQAGDARMLWNLTASWLPASLAQEHTSNHSGSPEFRARGGT